MADLVLTTLGQQMAGHYGHKAHGNAARHVEQRGERVASFGKRSAFVHEGGESGESATEACGEQ